MNTAKEQQQEPTFIQRHTIPVHDAIKQLGMITALLWFHVHHLEDDAHTECKVNKWVELAVGSSAFVTALAVDWFAVSRWWRSRLLSVLLLLAFVSYGMCAVGKAAGFLLFWPAVLLVYALMTEWHVSDPVEDEEPKEAANDGQLTILIALALLTMNGQKDSVKLAAKHVFRFLAPYLSVWHALMLVAVGYGTWAVFLGLLQFHPVEADSEDEELLAAKDEKSFGCLFAVMLAVAVFLFTGRISEDFVIAHISASDNPKWQTFAKIFPNVVFLLTTLAIMHSITKDSEEQTEKSIATSTWGNPIMFAVAWILLQALAIGLAFVEVTAKAKMAIAVALAALTIYGVASAMGYLSWATIVQFVPRAGGRTWLTAAFALVQVLFWKRTEFQAASLGLIKNATKGIAVLKVNRNVEGLVLAGGCLFFATLVLVSLIVWHKTKPVIVRQKLFL